MRTSTLLALALLTGGCTAAKANIQLVSAEQAVVRARSYGADQVAEYEYTMAVRYLEKAREEAGYSEFRIADALARKSAEWADRAIIFQEKRGKTDINLDDFSNVPDAASPPGPEPAQAPPPIPGEVPPPAPEPEPEADAANESPSEEATPAPAPETPGQGDFDIEDDLEIPR